MPPAQPRMGDRRIDACLDHFAFMGYDKRDVSAVVADLLKVYGGPDAWKFLEDDCYQVVQDRLLDMEDENKQKQDQQVLPEGHQQQDAQQAEDVPPQVPADRVLQKRVVRVVTHVSSSTTQPSSSDNIEHGIDQTAPRVSVGTHVSSSTTQPPSSDNIEHDIDQAAPRHVAEETGAEHGPRRGTRERRPSKRAKGPEWA